MSLEHPVGIVAVVLGIIAFHGSIYVVIALNTGWRFGYWISGATFGGFFFFIAAFWLITALGPRGDEPRWIPIATAQDTINQAQLEESTFTSLSRFPGGDWVEPGDEGVPPETEADAFKSAISNCLAVDDEALAELLEPEQSTCRQAQQFLPAEEALPKIEGFAVVMLPEAQDIRFTVEEGTVLGQAQVVPITRDPRLAEQRGVAEGEAVPVGEPFKIAAFRDPGSVRLPPLIYFIASILWFAFHLWGLNRAEKRKLSPVAG